MPYEPLIVIAIALFAALLFISQLLAPEVVAMTVLALLLLFGQVTPTEAAAGFSNPATLTVASMLVISLALYRTGAIEVVGRGVRRVSGGHPLLFILIMMAVVGLLSAFVNNTAVVSVFLPMLLVSAKAMQVPASKWLIPISFAAQAGGVSSLIGSSTNLLINSVYVNEGFPAITLFEMAKLGLPLLAMTILYFTLFGRWLLPSRQGKQLIDSYQLEGYITELSVMEGSPLIGQGKESFRQLAPEGLRLLSIIRNKEPLSPFERQTIEQGDVLLIEGSISETLALKEKLKLETQPEFTLQDTLFSGQNASLSEVLVAPRSRLVGRTLKHWLFRYRYSLFVLAIKREGETLHEKLNSVRLRMGDALLVQGSPEDIARLKEDPDFIFLQEVPHAFPSSKKALVATGIALSVVTVSALGILPIVSSSIIGAVLMLLTRSLRVGDIYESLDWSVIFLLAGIFPLGIALTTSGAAELLAKGISHLSLSFGPTAAIALIYFITTVLTEIMSNNAAGLLLTPIALSVASSFDVEAKPFVMAVVFAASTSFMTPIGYQTNALVQAPGGYKFIDYFRVGAPLNLLFWATSVWLIPQIWPF